MQVPDSQGQGKGNFQDVIVKEAQKGLLGGIQAALTVDAAQVLGEMGHHTFGN